MTANIPQPFLSRVGTVTANLSGDTSSVYTIPVYNLGITVDANITNPDFMGGMARSANRIGGKSCQLSFTTPLALPKSFNVSSGHNSVLGLLLRSCGYQELWFAGVYDSQLMWHYTNRAGVKNDPVKGHGITLFTDKSTNESEINLYRLKCLSGGTEKTSIWRFSGGSNNTESNIPMSELFSAQVYYPSNIAYVYQFDISISYTRTAADGSVSANTVLFGITAANNAAYVTGSVVYLMIGGEPFSYTLTSGDSSASNLAANLADAINASDLNRKSGFLADHSGSTLSIAYYNATWNAAVGFCPYDDAHASMGDSGGALSMVGSGGEASTANAVYTTGEKYSILPIPHESYLYVPMNAPVRDETGLIYNILPSAWETLEIPVRLDFCVYYRNKKHTVTNAIGTFSIDYSATGIPSISFVFSGLYDTPTERKSSTLTEYGVTDNRAAEVLFNVWGRNSGFVFGDYVNGIKLQSFSFSQENEIVKRFDFNSEDGYNEFIIGKRNPKGSFTLEYPPKYVMDIWQVFEDGQDEPMLLTLGDTEEITSLNGISLFIPSTQISSPPKEVDTNGIRSVSMEYEAVKPYEHSEADVYFIFS